MAKKKVITTVEEVDVDESKPKYDDIHGKDMREVVSEAEKVAKEAEKNPVEKKAEEDKEKIPEKKEEKVEVPVIDPEKLKKEVADETSKRIVEALTASDDDNDKKKKDEYEEWSDKVFSETGKRPNWKQAAEFIKEATKRELKAEQEEVAKKEEERVEQVKKQEAQTIKDINDFIDKELQDLYDENKLPKILNKDDEKDPGVVARRALFQAMADVNAKLDAEGKPKEYSIYKVFHKYYKSPTAQPAGSDAPVSAGNHGGSGVDTVKPLTYADLKKPWGQFMEELAKDNS